MLIDSQLHNFLNKHQLLRGGRRGRQVGRSCKPPFTPRKSHQSRRWQRTAVCGFNGPSGRGGPAPLAAAAAARPGSSSSPAPPQASPASALRESDAAGTSPRGPPLQGEESGVIRARGHSATLLVAPRGGKSFQLGQAGPLSEGSWGGDEAPRFLTRSLACRPAGASPKALSEGRRATPLPRASPSPHALFH